MDVAVMLPIGDHLRAPRHAHIDPNLELAALLTMLGRIRRR